jgi:murein L,D-transpeptidase YcbB/YkuD
VEANQEKESFNVIVGKKRTPTPVFSSSIEKVIANPYWTVPRSITFEMLHKIRKDSTYLARNGFFVINGREEVVDPSVIDWNSDDPLGKRYWLRQINSKYNALGQIKFIFPNDYSVYLHDTQSKSLFRHKNRMFSHGCVRLENPDKLAQYLTSTYTHQSNQNIEHLLSNSAREEINLSEKVKIHIQYITCSATENTDLIFYNDIYNLDQKELKEVFPNLL